MGSDLAAIHRGDLHLGPQVGVHEEAVLASLSHDKPRGSTWGLVDSQLTLPPLLPGPGCTKLIQAALPRPESLLILFASYRLQLWWEGCQCWFNVVRLGSIGVTS